MKIYCLGLDWRFGNRDYDSWPPIEYAHFSAVGTWTEGFNCLCGEHNQVLVSPLLVQWERSSAKIADFSYNVIYEHTFIVRERVAQFIRENGFDCKLYPVEYVPPDSKSKKNLVPYPYTGPQQYWLECETYLEFDMEASGAAIVKPACSVCGHVPRYTFRHNHMFIRKSAWHNEKMFRVRTNTNYKSVATYVTQEGLDLLLSQNYTNFLYLEAGQIVE